MRLGRAPRRPGATPTEGDPIPWFMQSLIQEFDYIADPSAPVAGTSLAVGLHRHYGMQVGYVCREVPREASRLAR